MILWHKNLIKMNINKSVFSFSILVKLQPSCLPKKTFMKKIQQQNFSLSSCFFCDRNRNSASKISCTGIEQITTLQRISKKKNKLSKVEEKDLEIVESCKKGNIPYKNEHSYKDFIVEDLKVIGRRAFYYMSKVKTGSLKPERFHNNTDILVIGSGAVGLTIAYFIKTQFPHGPKVIVVDKDDSYPHLSTNLGQGVVSLQMFNEEEEISVLKYGAEFFSSFTRNTKIQKDIQFDLHYDPLGSLLLVDRNNADKVMKNHECLKKFGVNNLLLDTKTLKAKFPWLNVDNILFGSLGMFGEGIIDPWSYIYGLKCKCESLGVKFVTGEVIDFGYEKDDIRRAVLKLPNGSYNFINFVYCILAGGLESLNIVNLFNESDCFELGLKLPLEERMRYEYCFYNPDGPGLNTPIIFNSDGTYFRREGLTGHYVAGVPSVVCNENDNDEESSPYHVFNRVVKPFLMQRLANLKKIDLTKGWIDVYDFCAANNVGITGPHPCTPRVVFALGFSHMGLQYLPALGRGVMEYLIYDTYQTINFEPFHIENLWRKQHLEADEKRRKLLEAQEQVALSE